MLNDHHEDDYARRGRWILLNVLKEELPDEGQSDFRAFIIGVVAYTALLLVL